MRTLIDFAIREEYSRVKALGDNLSDINCWFGLSDPELERQVTDRISFRIFLGTTEVIPDFSTVWLFRERLIECGRYEDLWKELQMKLDEKGFIVKKGTIQDATFITSDPGQKRDKKDEQGQDKKDQNLEAIKASQIKDFDKYLLNISNNIINSNVKTKRLDGGPINEGSIGPKTTISIENINIEI